MAGMHASVTEVEGLRKTAPRPVAVDVPEKPKWDGNDDACKDEDEQRMMIPPHELLARRRTSGRAAYSMCQGVGRTLKGRDLVNLRNAVLAKTGFIE